jgi:hypothetical protein
VIPTLQEVVGDDTAGDPITGLRWTHKTTRNLAEQLNRIGFRVSHTTVARLLRLDGYSLRTNRKRLARTHKPERDRQFRLIERRRRWYLSRDLPQGLRITFSRVFGSFSNEQHMRILLVLPLYVKNVRKPTDILPLITGQDQNGN